MRTYLGLDLSLTETGWACLAKDEEVRKVGSGTIKVSRKSGEVERLRGYREEIWRLVKKMNPDVVVMEGYAMRAFGRLFSIGEQGGVIRLLLMDLGKPFYIVAPTGLKKFATGKGNAGKGEVMVSVFKKWGEEFGNDNEADAYVAARMAIGLDDPTGLTKYELDSLGKCERLYAGRKERKRI